MPIAITMHRTTRFDLTGFTTMLIQHIEKFFYTPPPEKFLEWSYYLRLPLSLRLIALSSSRKILRVIKLNTIPQAVVITLAIM